MPAYLQSLRKQCALYDQLEAESSQQHRTSKQAEAPWLLRLAACTEACLFLMFMQPLILAAVVV
jgi:hypothetical protein